MLSGHNARAGPVPSEVVWLLSELLGGDDAPKRYGDDDGDGDRGGDDEGDGVGATYPSVLGDKAAMTAVMRGLSDGNAAVRAAVGETQG